MVKVSFSFNSQGFEKIKLSSQGTNSSINLRYNSLITNTRLQIEVPLFAFLDVKLWPKEADYLILKYSLKFIHLMSKITDFFQSPFYIPIYLGSTIIRLLIAQILTALDPLGEKLNF